MGSSTENSAYGTTRNPWDPDRIARRSSGGSAAAVAVGSAFAGLGSDTGGSIRQPGSLTGTVGMKPTYGLVSRYGLIAFASSLDQIGPLTRTVDDSVTVFEAIAGHDPPDATSYRGRCLKCGRHSSAGVKGLKGGHRPRVVRGRHRTRCRRIVPGDPRSLLAGAGAEIRELSLPSTEYASVYYLIAPAECSANLARFDGVRYGPRLPGKSVEGDDVGYSPRWLRTRGDSGASCSAPMP